MRAGGSVTAYLCRRYCSVPVIFCWWSGGEWMSPVLSLILPPLGTLWHAVFVAAWTTGDCRGWRIFVSGGGKNGVCAFETFGRDYFYPRAESANVEWTLRIWRLCRSCWAPLSKKGRSMGHCQWGGVFRLWLIRVRICWHWRINTVLKCVRWSGLSLLLAWWFRVRTGRVLRLRAICRLKNERIQVLLWNSVRASGGRRRFYWNAFSQWCAVSCRCGAENLHPENAFVRCICIWTLPGYRKSSVKQSQWRKRKEMPNLKTSTTFVMYAGWRFAPIGWAKCRLNPLCAGAFAFSCCGIRRTTTTQETTLPWALFRCCCVDATLGDGQEAADYPAQSLHHPTGRRRNMTGENQRHDFHHYRIGSALAAGSDKSRNIAAAIMMGSDVGRRGWGQ